MVKVVILGSTGAVGKQFIETLTDNKINFVKFNRKNLNIENKLQNLKSFLINEKEKNIIVVNCIGFTGLNNCKRNKDLAYKINYTFPIKLSKLTSQLKIKLIHFSTEAVFNGTRSKKIYSEKSKPNPGTIYGITKFKADKKLLNQNNVLIVRLPLLFGKTHNKQIISILIKKLLKNEKIYVAGDVFSTPIYTPDLCEFIIKNCIISDKFINKKLIHLSSEKKLSIYHFIIKLSKSLRLNNLHNIIEVKDSYFKNNLENKPRHLGLTSVYKNCKLKINYNNLIV